MPLLNFRSLPFPKCGKTELRLATYPFRSFVADIRHIIKSNDGSDGCHVVKWRTSAWAMGAMKAMGATGRLRPVKEI
eukprot:7756081-Karenia_brevis.AAC.1